MDLSEDAESRRRGAVDGTLEGAFSGPAIEGENETPYTGPECPIRRRELEGGGSLGPDGRVDGKAPPERFQTRM
jgi:hypothetical protein